MRVTSGDRIVNRASAATVIAPSMPRNRKLLLVGTALQAAFIGGLSTTAQAQSVPAALTARAATLSPTALPTGGNVVAGSANISQSGATLNVTQSSNNAGINWRSFDVGSAGTVNFTAPSPQSLTINRVVGPDPSVIAGKINANNQQVLINQSGVLFTNGAQVNASSLVVSAIGITDANLKAGRLVLDQPANPGAAVVNQGQITVAQTGLAALVAPQVINSGVIQAKMGRVVLAGAEAATVDLYGDGLMSIDVTKQVSTAPTGPDGKPVTSLVTNTGTIQAQGGTILLTAQAAEGIVTNLVTAGGKISANTVADGSAGGRVGQIAINGTGGNVTVSGKLSAQGKAAGTKGGQIEVNTTGAAVVGSQARINASGAAGGGTVALGTTIARAKGGPGVSAATASQAVIAPGATIKADATQNGNGGNVTVLSTTQTYMGGSISARGGKTGGDGGFVEISGKTGFSLTGSVDVSSFAGAPGSILIDPDTLNVVAAAVNPVPTFTPDGAGGGSITAPTTGTADILPGTFNLLTGNVTLAAGTLLSIQTAITSSSIGGLILTAPTVDLSANAVTLTAANSTLSLQANTLSALAGAGLSAPTVEIAPFTSGTAMTFGGASTGLNVSATLPITANVLRLGKAAGATNASSLDITSALTTPGTVDLNSSGAITQSAAITAAFVGGAAGTNVTLTSANVVPILGPFTATAGALSFTTTKDLTTNGLVKAGSGALTLNTTGKNLVIGGGAAATLEASGALNLSGVGGTITGGPNSVTFKAGADFSLPQNITTAGATTVNLGTNAFGGNGKTLSTGGNTLSITAGNIDLTSSALTASTVTLNASGTINDAGTGVITAASLTGSAAGAATLTGANVIDALGPFSSTGGALSLTTTKDLTTSGLVKAGGGALTLSTGSKNLVIGNGTAATLEASGALNLSGVGGSITGGANSVTLKAGADFSLPKNITTSGATIVNLGGSKFSAAGKTLNSGANPLSITAGNIDLSAASSALTGSTVTLTSTGTIDGGTNGVITATTLTGSATGAVTLGGANAVANLGAFSAAGFSLTNNADLNINGLVNGGTSAALDVGTHSLIEAVGGEVRGTGSISLKSGFLQLGGLVDDGVAGTPGAGTVTVNATGNAAVVSGGTVSAGTVAITASTADMFLNVGGLVKTSGSLTLTSGAAAGPADANASIKVLLGGTLDGGTVSLVALDTTKTANAIAQDSTGVIRATTFNASAASGSITLNAAGNTIGTVGVVSTPSNFTIANTGTTQFGGNVSAATFDLSSTGNVTQTAGTISATTLTSTSGLGGSATLTRTGNAIVNLGPMAVTGTLALRSDSNLAIAGAVSASSIYLTEGKSAGVLAINTPFGISTGGTLALQSDTITASAGSLNANPLGLIEIASNASAAFATGSGPLPAGLITLINSGLSSSGTLHLGAIGSGTSTASSMSLGALDLTGKTLSLTSAGGIAQTGIIKAGTLVGSATGGAIDFGTQANVIGNIGTSGLSATTGIKLRDTSALSVAGSVSLSSAGTISIATDTFGFTGAGALSASGGAVELGPNSAAVVRIGTTSGTGIVLGDLSKISASTLRIGSTSLNSNTAGAINLTGNATTAASTLRLAASTADTTGTISQSAGTLSANTIVASAGGDITLAQSGNVFTGLGDISSGGSISLHAGTGSTLSVTGTLASAADKSISITANSIDVSGALSVANTAGGGLVKLSANTVTVPGTITNTGGTVSVAPNTLGTAIKLGGTGGLALANINAPTVLIGRLTAGGTTTAGSIDFGGNSVSNATNLGLFATGAVTQTGGGLKANTLFGNAASFALTNTNTIGTLGVLTSTSGGISVIDTGTLNVSGPVSAAGGQTISLTADTLKVTGTASSTIVALGGTIALIADTLTLPASPVADLINTGTGLVAITPRTLNKVMSFSAPTGTTPLGITTGTLELGGFNGSTLAGDLTLGVINLTGSLIVHSTGSIAQTGSLAITGTLTGNASGTAKFDFAGNSVPTLGDFTAAGFVLKDTVALSVTGKVNGTASTTIDTGTKGLTVAAGGEIQGTSTVSLSSGLLTINGRVDDGAIGTPGSGTVTLTSSGNIVASSGTLTAGTLTGSATGSATLTGTNLVSNLGSFTAAGFNMKDGAALNVTGLVNGTTSATIDTGSLGLTVATGAEVKGTGTVSLSSGLMTINGRVDDGAIGTPGSGTVTLTSIGNIVGSSGTLTAGTLNGSATGSVLLTGTNLVPTLGNFSAAGFSFKDGRALNVAGLVNGTTAATIDTGSNALTMANGAEVKGTSTVSLSGGLLTINGRVDDGAIGTPGSGTVTLSASGNIVESAGTLTAGTLTGSATGSATLTGTNLVSNVGNFTAAGFNVKDGTALNVTGLVNGTTAATIDTGANALTVATGGEVQGTSAVLLKSGLMTINGRVDDGAIGTPGSGTVTLTSSGNIVENAGTLTAGTLTGSATGSATLTGTNLVSTLSNFTAAGFNMKDGRALNVTGLVNGTTAATIDTGTNGLTVASGAEVQGTGTVFLNSGLMTINGRVDDGAIGTPGTGTVTLTSSGNIVESGGTLTAGTLTGSATGSATLTGTNLVSTLGNFTAAGFTMKDGRALNVTGLVNGTTAATIDTGTNGLTVASGAEVQGTSTVFLNSGLMTINGRVDDGAIGTPGTGTVTLTSSGNIVENAGTLTAGTLTGSATGSATLTGTNLVSTLGNFTAAGFTLTDGRALNVTGLVNGTTAATIDTGANALTVATGGEVQGTGTVFLNSGLLTINGRVDDGAIGTPGTGTVTLTSSNNIVESAGTLTAGTLNGSASGSATLTGTNLVSTLGNFTAAGFTMKDGRALNVTGLVNGTTSATIDTGSNGLTVASGAEVQGTGTVLLNSGLMTINGRVDDGAIGTPGTGTVTLTSSGNIVESAGTLTAGTLNGSATGSATLTGTNLVSTLGNFTAAGFNMKDGTALNVTGLVNGTTAATIDTGTNGLTVATGGEVQGTSAVLLKSGLMTINGRVDDGAIGTPGSGTVTLTSSGNIVENAGTLTAGTLTGSATGSATLTGTNLVSTLSNFTAAGFNMKDGRALNVTGLVNGTTAATIDTGTNGLTVASGAEVQGTGTVFLNSGLMTINGRVDDGAIGTPGTGTVTLTSSGNIVESGGTLTAGTLTGSATGSATLTGTNLVSTLGNFTAAGFNMKDGRALNVTGLVNGTTAATIDTGTNGLTVASGAEVQGTSTVFLNSGLMTINGRVDDGAIGTPGTGTVTLTSSGNIVENAGTLTAGTLTGSATGSATLTGTNLVSTLGNFTAAGFTLTDGRALNVTGLVNGTTAATIDTGANALTVATGGEVQGTGTVFLNSGLLTINGRVDDGAIGTPGTGTVTLTSSNNIVESAGTLTAGTLNGSASGSATLTGTNLVSTLGNFTAAGFTMKDGRALNVTGLVNGTTSATIDTGSNGLTVASGAEVQGTGTVLLNSGLMTINGRVDDGAIGAPGTGIVTLTSSGNIVESAGTLTAGTLNGSATGSATLTGTNLVSTLGNFTAAGFNMKDGTALNVTGLVNGTTAATIDTGANALTVATGGEVQGTSAVLLKSGLMTINGRVDDGAIGTPGSGTVTLTSSGNIVENAGTLTAGTLTGSATGLATLTGTNLVSTLSNFTAAGFNMKDGRALNVTGLVNGTTAATIDTGTNGLTVASGAEVQGTGTVFLNSGLMTINGRVDDGAIGTPGTGTVTLTSSGNIVESGGTLTAGTLTGSATGSATLTGTNLVSTLGNFTAAGFNMKDGRALNVTGLVNGTTAATIDTGTNGLTVASGAEVQGTSTVFLNSGLMTINGRVDDGAIGTPGTGTVTLTSSGNIVESGGTLTAGTLTGNATGSATLTGTNLVSTLGNFTAAGFTLTDGRALNVTGLVNGTTSATIDTGANALTVATGGEVQGTGTVFLNSGLLTINGRVDDGAIGTPGTGTVTLTSSNNIVESAGTLTAGTLNGSASGSATLTGTNLVSTLGNFTAAGFTMKDGRALNVTGLVNGTTSATIDTGSNGLTVASGAEVQGTGTVLLNSGLMTINGRVDDGAIGTPGTGIVTLTSSGNIVESAGTLTAGTLNGSATGSATLTGTNLVSTLGNFTAAGFNMKDGTALNVTGLVNGTTAATIDTGANALTVATGGEVQGTSAVLLKSGLMTINGRVDDGAIGTPGSGTVTLTSSGNIVENAGTLTAGTLTGSASGSATLTGTNLVSTLSNFTAAGFNMKDGRALNVTGLVNGTTAATIDTGTNGLTVASGAEVQGTGTVFLNSGLMTINGRVDDGVIGTPGLGTVTLTSSGNIVESAGTLTAGSLSGSATGSATLTGTNNIATLLSFSSGGNFALADASAVTQIGLLSAPSGSVVITDTNAAASAISANGTIRAGATLSLLAPNGGIAINGALNGGTLVNLAASGAGVAEAAGATITAPQLTGSLSSAGTISLIGTGNAISGVGDVTAVGGTITLVDTVDPRVNGTVTANAVTLNETGPGGITVTGTLNGANTLTLNAAGGGVRAASGRIITSNLSSSTGITGDTVLTGSNNQIGTLGRLAVSSGALQLTDATSLTLSGPVSASNGATLTVNGGNLTLAGPLSSAGQVVTLASTGALNQTGGVITAGTLNASGSTVSLGQGNLVNTLGTLSSVGTVLFRDAQSFTAGGPVSGSTVTLSSTNDINLASTVTASGAFDVSTTGGSVNQTGGTVSAATLLSSGGISGGLALNNAGNRIGTLGSVTTGGGLSIVDGVSLNVAGPVNAAGAGRLSSTGSITLSGNWTGASLDLSTGAGGVTQTGGVLTVGTLSGSGGINGAASFTSGGNRIASLGQTTVSGGNLVLVDSVNLAVNGPLVTPNTTITTSGSLTLPGTINTGTLSLSTGGTIVRPAGAGTFTVGFLTGNAVTNADFGKNANVTQLGGFVVTGSTLSLDNAQPLTITGPLTAEYIGITATGLLTLSGIVNTVGLPASIQLASSSPVDPGTYFAVRADSSGNAAINQIGTLTIRSTNDTSPTVRFYLPASGGKITMENTQATTTTLLLSTGAGGITSGNVNIGGLVIVGTGGSSTLTGTVKNTTGAEAARLAQIQPQPNTTYRLNGCPISSVNCVLIPLGTLPAANPLRDFVLDTGRYNSDDDDVALPDISSRDY